MKPAYHLLVVLLLFYSQATLALRCGRNLVEIGYYKDDVTALCGDPDTIETHTEIRGYRNYANQNLGRGGAIFPNSNFSYGQDNFREVEVIVDTWIYNFGRQRLKQQLRFENGVLQDIRSVGRGRYR